MSNVQTENITKHFKIGGEIEMFTLDMDGRIVNRARELLEAVALKYPKIAITKECGKNMIEFGVPPDVSTAKVMHRMTSDVLTVVELAAELGIQLYPYSTYPGDFTPEFNEDDRYKAQENIFGKDRFRIAAECVGHHCHYTLPYGVFDGENKILKPLVNSKHKQSLVNIYNMAIAMDPALTVFAQSSPFFRGKYMGKDSRIIAYRGGRALKNKDGLYAKYQKFGALQQYKHTGTDLIHTIENKNRHWLSIVKKHAPTHHSAIANSLPILATAWNPVKVNPHGTIELRGMDMNFMSILTATDLIINTIGRLIQEDFVQIVPSDIGLVAPFKQERNIIYIPPYSHVRLHLQYESAYKGLASDDVYKYASALFKLAKRNMPKDQHPLLQPLADMLKKRKTTSDKILSRLKKEGWEKDQEIIPERAATLANTFAQEFKQDLIETKERLEKYTVE